VAAALVAVRQVRDGGEARGGWQSALGEGAQLVGVEVRSRARGARPVATRVRPRATVPAQQRVNLFVEALFHLTPKSSRHAALIR